MLQKHSVCPICDTPIQDPTIDRCDRCRWVIGIDDSLNPRMQDRLLKWSKHYYKLTVDYASELENLCRDEYKHKRLEDRLNRQRDEIDYIKTVIPQILTNIEEIKSILTVKDKILDRDEDFPIDMPTSTKNSEDSNSLETAEPLESTIVNRQNSIVKEESNTIETELTLAQQEIISDYYHKPREFAAKYQVKIANITKDSINSNRGNEEKIVVLEETNRGNYWIFIFGGCTYLVPVEDKYINQHSYTSTSTIFEGHNYTPDYKKIQLIKPAIVSIDPNSNPQTWRLQQQGELAFL